MVCLKKIFVFLRIETKISELTTGEYKMSDVSDSVYEDDVDEVIGSAVLLLLEQNEEISSLSVLKAIRSSSFTAEGAKNKAILLLLDSLKPKKSVTEVYKKIPL